MLFVFYCCDKPGQEQLRIDNRSAHLQYIDGFKDKLFTAGPTFSEDGETMTGSIIIMDFADRKQAQSFVDNDPYARAGLFASVTIKRWKKVLP